MVGRVPLVGAAKVLDLKRLTRTGRLSRTGQLVAAGVFLVTVLVGVVTSTVTSQRGWGLIGGIATLVLLTVAGMALTSRQTAPTGNVDMNIAEIGINFPYGVPRIPANAGRWLGRLLGNVMPAAYAEFVSGSAETELMVNLMDKRNELEKALEAGRSNVILVHGPPGAGKSMLVSCVLRETGHESEAQWHDLASGDLDAKTLLDDIGSGTRAGAALKPGEDVLSRLEAEMGAQDGSPVTIVVDGAQHLFDPHNHTMASLELAEVLEVIASRRPRRVKVILIVQESPTAGPESAWHGTAERVYLGGLHRKDFRILLGRLDPAFEFGLVGRTAVEFDRLYNLLQGNPRLAELFCAALGMPESQLSAVDLMQLLERELLAKREGLLATKLVDSMSAEQRRVVAALAAFGMPVTIEHVNKLLERNTREGNPSAGRVGVLLPELVNWHVISEAPDHHYYLPTPAIQEALLQSKELSAEWLMEARNALKDYLTPKERIQRPEDLRWHFAQLDILVRAGQMKSSRESWESAYGLTNRMDEMLQRWNAAGLLLKYREASKGNLKRPYWEMVNSNALGCIYMARGRYGDARRAFSDALGHESTAKSWDGRRKILINLATLYWNFGDTSEETSKAEGCYIDALEDYYIKALAKTPDDDDVLDLVAAEAGLADCYRRWGRYSEAIDHGGKALSAARDQGSPWSVGIAVKLARWHAEQGRREEADRLMKVADQAAADHADPALRMVFLAGQADLLLDAGHFRRARSVAKQALSSGLELNDPVMVSRASITLAMAYLELGDIAAARDEIGRASRCWPEGRSLDVLALQALIASRSDQDEEARDLFTELEREAVHCQKRDKRDFAAWDFEGLAICGKQVGLAASLDQAKKAFRQAREHVWAPGLDARLKRWLEILKRKATPGQLDDVLAAIDKTTARPEPS